MALGLPGWPGSRTLLPHEATETQHSLCQLPALAEATGYVPDGDRATATDRPATPTATGCRTQRLLHFLQTAFVRHRQVQPAADLGRHAPSGGGTIRPPQTRTCLGACRTTHDAPGEPPLGDLPRLRPWSAGDGHPAPRRATAGHHDDAVDRCGASRRGGVVSALPE